MTSHFCLFTDWGPLGYWSPIYDLNSVKPGGEKGSHRQGSHAAYSERMGHQRSAYMNITNH